MSLREKIEGLARWERIDEGLEKHDDGEWVRRAEVLAAVEERDPSRIVPLPALPVGQAGGEQLYFIQDKRQYVGNDVLWWRPDGNGYTCQIDEAGRFTAEYCRSLRDTDVAWCVEDILPLATRVVDAQRMSGIAPAQTFGISEQLPTADGAVVCKGCGDSHRVWSESREQWELCRRCPSPCQTCRLNGNGPYCALTPCKCECHRTEQLPDDAPAALQQAQANQLTRILTKMSRHFAQHHQLQTEDRTLLNAIELWADWKLSRSAARPKGVL